MTGSVQSININICVMSWGQLGPNRQEIQFSELSEVIQKSFASYMQRIP